LAFDPVFIAVLCDECYTQEQQDNLPNPSLTTWYDITGCVLPLYSNVPQNPDSKQIVSNTRTNHTIPDGKTTKVLAASPSSGTPSTHSAMEGMDGMAKERLAD
jgi:hypothetical protein